MPALPQHFLAVGAKVAGARAIRRYRESPLAAQQHIFNELTEAMSQCSFHRSNGLEKALSYEAFRKKIPLFTYEQLARVSGRYFVRPEVVPDEIAE